MLEECGLDCALHIVDITAGEQDLSAFRAINPNGRRPAIVDADGPDGAPLASFESGAIVLYLAQKTGLFLPEDEKDRWIATQWLLSRIKILMDSMVYKVWYVTLYQNVSHPVSQIIRQSSGKVSQTRQEPRPSRRDRLVLVVHVPLRCRDRLVAKPLFDP
jgi:glutathione S-transferase